jgi:hypothetical protein
LIPGRDAVAGRLARRVPLVCHERWSPPVDFRGRPPRLLLPHTRGTTRFVIGSLAVAVNLQGGSTSGTRGSNQRGRSLGS